MASGILQQPSRAVIYARVSTTNHGQDVSMQTRELRQFAEARGWTFVGEYVDEGISGTKDRRPALDRLMSDAHKRKFDVVVCWRFDRFARSVSHLLRALETFNALAIAFVSLSENVDTTTPTGKMIFTVLGAVAELERNLIVERVRAGLRSAPGLRLWSVPTGFATPMPRTHWTAVRLFTWCKRPWPQFGGDH